MAKLQLLAEISSPSRGSARRAMGFIGDAEVFKGKCPKGDGVYRRCRSIQGKWPKDDWVNM